MSATTRWLALSLALPLAGCYEFDAPLGPASLPVDKQLLGDWRCVGFEPAGGDADKIVHLQFKAMDLARYEITSPEMCDHDDCPGVFRAHASRVADTTFLNTQMVHKDGTVDPNWTFARVRLHDPAVLHLDLVEDKAFNDVPETTDALRKALEKRMKNPGTFSEFCVCARVGSAGKDPL